MCVCVCVCVCVCYDYCKIILCFNSKCLTLRLFYTIRTEKIVFSFYNNWVLHVKYIIYWFISWSISRMISVKPIQPHCSHSPHYTHTHTHTHTHTSYIPLFLSLHSPISGASSTAPAGPNTFPDYCLCWLIWLLSQETVSWVQ